jgi:hypothetical protein
MADNLADALYPGLAFALGALVALAELLARYTDEPFKAVRKAKSLGYLGVNGVASLAAFGLLLRYEDQVLPSLSGDRLLAALIAGFGAMALIRSKLINLPASEDGSPSGLGPDWLVTSLLGVMDAGIDRERSVERQQLVVDRVRQLPLAEIDGAKARIRDFLIVSIASFQNLNDAQKAELKTVVEDIVALEQDTDLALMAVSYAFLNAAGEDKLIQILDQVKDVVSS